VILDEQDPYTVETCRALQPPNVCWIERPAQHSRNLEHVERLPDLGEVVPGEGRDVLARHDGSRMPIEEQKQIQITRVRQTRLVEKPLSVIQGRFLPKGCDEPPRRHSNPPVRRRLRPLRRS
jgi:hypothetical protein